MKESIYQTMRKRILYLEYKPGQILNEKVLSEEFGVSRSPIKNVLNRLEWEELVRVIPRTGSMVTDIEFSKVMNIYQIRFEIESFEAGLAEEKFSSKHMSQLKDLCDDCQTVLDEKDPKALAQIDAGLRNIIHDAAGNFELEKLSDRLYSQTFRLWYIVMGKNDWHKEVNAVKKELMTILDYFVSGKSKELASIRRNQLIYHVERLRLIFLGTSR